MAAASKFICASLFAVLFFALFSGCENTGGKESSEKPVFSSYRDLPGVTAEEIAAIEALRAKTDYFIYGMLPNTESFRNTEGEIRGFAALLCQWLTEFFGIPFIPELYTWVNLIEGLESGEIDFTGELTANEERRKTYYMTDAIAERLVDFFYIEGSPPLSETAASRPLRYAFLEGVTLTDDIVAAHDPNVAYELFFVQDQDQAYHMLKSGEIDAFFDEENAKAAFDGYGDVAGKHFFPPVLSPVSMTAQNPELEPIINLVQKAIKEGALSRLDEMYDRGNSEYRRHTLFTRLTEEERSYIRNNPIIPYVTQYNNYSMSFFNEKERRWQGIIFDILNEIEELTGLSFQLAHGDTFIKWPFLLEMVESGRAAFVTELIRTEERKGRFIWLDTTLATEYLTLVSRSEQRSVRLNEIKNMTVGVVRNTAQTQAFYRWFPNHDKIVEYDDTKDAFLAMRRGEVDLVMSSTSNLLVMTNYLELTGFKANVVFDNAIQESTIGLNMNEDLLRSIIDKALKLIDTKAFSDDWKNRTFDYRYKLIEAQRPLLIGAVALSLIILALVSFFLIRSRNAEKRLERRVRKRTNELAIQTSMLHTMVDSIPDHLFCKDFNSNYTLCNKFMADYFGLDKDDIIGKGDADGLKMPAGLAEEMLDIDQKVLRDGQLTLAENWIPSPGGAQRLFETTKVPLMQDGAIVGLIGIAHDITERKAMEEEALSASRSKSAFLATMSHEIRTPMNSILGFAELAADSGAPPQVKDYLSKITDSAKLLLHIINDILDISKIESGKMEL